MYDDEYPPALVCRCGHIAESHLWVLKEEESILKAEPINLDGENFAHGYAISKCWVEQGLEGRPCQCEILTFEFAGNWAELAERMNIRIENLLKYRVKRIGIEP